MYTPHTLRYVLVAEGGARFHSNVKFVQVYRISGHFGESRIYIQQYIRPSEEKRVTRVLVHIRRRPRTYLCFYERARCALPNVHRMTAVDSPRVG